MLSSPVAMGQYDQMAAMKPSVPMVCDDSTYFRVSRRPLLATEIRNLVSAGRVVQLVKAPVSGVPDPRLFFLPSSSIVLEYRLNFGKLKSAFGIEPFPPKISPIDDFIAR